MKILFVGDYSNLHACLAGELRRQGHEATVVSDGGRYQHTAADYLLQRGNGFMGAVRYLSDVMSLWPKLSGYDVVQLINPHFLNLRPGKLSYFFRELRKNNGRVFMTLCGNDHFYVKACVRSDIFRFSEFRVGHEKTPFAVADAPHEYGYLQSSVERFSELIYSEIDGGMAVLPEYDMAARPVLGDRCVFTNLPIDLATHPAVPFEVKGKLRVLAGFRPESELSKGAGRIMDALKRIEERRPGEIEIVAARGIAYRDYLELMRSCHLVADQLYAYSPATNALDAMALQRVPASGAEPEYYEMIGEPTRRPIIPLSPFIPDLTSHLEEYLFDRDRLARMAREGREIVEAHNDSAIVARKFLEAWRR